MSLEDTRALFESEWQTNFGSSVPTRYENRRFQEPEEEIWASIEIDEPSGFQASLGNAPYKRYSGMFVVKLFAPEHSGSKSAKTLADSIVSLFQCRDMTKRSSGQVTTRVGYIKTVGPVENGFYQFNIVLPYVRNLAS